MSIWSSVGGPTIPAITDGEDAAWYGGQGEPTGWVDVATTGFHPLIRLSLTDDQHHVDSQVLLTAAACRLLADRLDAAADQADKR